MEYKVHRTLWENLEAVLLAQSKKYIEELADRLQVSAKELQKRVMPSADSIKVMIQEVNQGTCQAFVQQGQFTVYCRKSVHNAMYCSEHQFHRQQVLTHAAIPIQRVKDIDSLPAMWKKGNELYHANGSLAGKINEDKQKIKIYCIDNE